MAKTSRDLIRLSASGLIGPDDLFQIDSWGRSDINLVTHAHSDHARVGSKEYWCVDSCAPILRHRLGQDIKLRTFQYGETTKIGNSWVSFHPAGHILGSAQVRVENGSDVWVFTGDFKRDLDPTCAPFEVVECDTFITEATFALPIYSWQPMSQTAREIMDWVDVCKREGLTALLFCYSLGKAQRVLAEIKDLIQDEVLLHGAMVNLTQIYRDQGVAMAKTISAAEFSGDPVGRLVLAPPAAHRSPWMKRFKSVSTGFASGWMAIRGVRRRRGYERGFVISDHADWKSLVTTIEETKASRILVTHGDGETFARYLRETKGLNSQPLKTQFSEEEEGT